jgi:hypothetical protein
VVCLPPTAAVISVRAGTGTSSQPLRAVTLLLPPQLALSQNAGTYDARITGLRDPEPMSEAKRASLLGSVGLIDGAC